MLQNSQDRSFSKDVEILQLDITNTVLVLKSSLLNDATKQSRMFLLLHFDLIFNTVFVLKSSLLCDIAKEPRLLLFQRCGNIVVRFNHQY